MSRSQLPLPLGHRPALGREDFLVAPGNAEAVAWIDRWPDWPAPMLVLHGPAGCGKTHLAHVLMARAGAIIASGPALDPPALLRAPAVIVDDAERVAAAAGGEAALFHLFNAAKEADRKVLLTARTAPARWDLCLPDLRSRLQSVPTAEIGPPDDAVIAAVLVKLFADRQVRVGTEVIAYLLRHMERSHAAAVRTVEAADTASLAEKRPVTIPLVKRLLDEMRRS